MEIDEENRLQQIENENLLSSEEEEEERKRATETALRESDLQRRQTEATAKM